MSAASPAAATRGLPLNVPPWSPCSKQEAASVASKAQMIPQTRKYKVLLVDDHPIVRQGLALLIDREADLAVCGEAEGAHSAFQAIAIMRPDLVVLDISLSGPDGLDVLSAAVRAAS